MVASASGRTQWLQSVSNNNEQRAIRGLSAADSVLAWTSDGASLLLRTSISVERERVDRLSLATGVRTVLHEIPAPEPGDVFRREFVVADDGRAFAFSFQRDLASLYLVRGVQ